MKKNIILARVGRNSLHRRWINEETPRNWDLYLCPFQEIEASAGHDCIMGDVIPGQKWEGLRTVLNQWDGWRDYENIWLPDDDIMASQDDISAMFQAASDLGFKLFAPSLSEDSHYAHYVTMRNRSFFARRVGFVEIMIPGFSRSTLEHLLPTLDLSTTGWGWGLDSLWPKLLDYEDIGIFDGIPVRHTRPVGQFRDESLLRNVMAESDRMLKDHDCGHRMITFGGIGADFEDVRQSADQLLVSLVEGWRYLLQQNPEALRWMVDHQRSLFDDSVYPAAGLPTSPLPRSNQPSPTFQTVKHGPAETLDRSIGLLGSAQHVIPGLTAATNIPLREGP